MTKALIIDDEKHCSDNLRWQLEQYCPLIEVAAICNTAEKGLEQINKQQPQLVFLDVEMPGMNGFELLEKVKDINFNVIFTTAFDQYAIRAIKFGALDYLLKPVDKDELLEAVNRHPQASQQDSLKQLNALLSHIQRSNDLSFQKIALPTMHSYELVALNDIVVCESKNNYTDVRLHNGQHIVISKTLKQVEELLDMSPFFRVHNSFLVNLQYAIRYVKGEGGSLILNNDMNIPVSRSKKEELLKLITHLSV
jgi:two-component system, LytTR family, response regulator